VEEAEGVLEEAAYRRLCGSSGAAQAVDKVRGFCLDYDMKIIPSSHNIGFIMIRNTSIMR